MNEKLKKLAKKVEGLISGGETPQQVYDLLIGVAKKQKDYFSHLGPDNIIKLTFYIYSIKNTNNFDLGDKMINNLSFIKLVQTEGNHTVNSCEECGGDGYVRCDVCDSTGKIECDYCDGSGEVEGEVEGFETCDDCGGDGEIDCEECGGDGEMVCNECGGNGEVESDSNYDFYVVSIVTWDRNIANVCELRENSGEPAMSEYDFDRLRDDYIMLFSDERSAPIDIQENELYCIQITTEPELRFMQTMDIKMLDLRGEFDHLLQ